MAFLLGTWFTMISFLVWVVRAPLAFDLKTSHRKSESARIRNGTASYVLAARVPEGGEPPLAAFTDGH
jgi:hypothetical protein